MVRRRKLIYDLFGGTGAWSRPYYENPEEYWVVMVDPRANRSRDDLQLSIQELHEMLKDLPRGTFPHGQRPYGILGAFPCKQFALSGSRLWKKKDKEKPWLIEEARDNVIQLLGCVSLMVPEEFCCFENPVGRVMKEVPQLGRWSMTFNPCDFGGWLDPPGDNYTKRTCLYGEFNHPEKRPVPPTQGSIMGKMPQKKGRDYIRAITPQGFARAFYAANR